MNWFAIGGLVAAIFYGFLFAVAFRRPMLAGIRQLMSQKRSTLGALAILAIVASVNAQKPGDGSGTNDTNNAGMDFGDDGGTNMMMCAGRSILRKPSLPVSLRDSSLSVRNAPLRSGNPSTIPDFTVTAEDISRGYKLVSETNDVNHDYSMPADSIDIGHLGIHGASSDFGKYFVDLTEYPFKLGTNDTYYSRVWLNLDGRLRVKPKQKDPCILAGPGLGNALAIQGEASLMTKLINNIQVITWRNIHPGGDTNITDNYQIKLGLNGSFETWSNELGRVWEYVPPNDHDNDGLCNDDDPNPTNYWYGIAAGCTTFSVPETIMRGGYMGLVTVGYAPPLVIDNASAALSIAGMANNVSLWEDAEKTIPVTLPMALTPGSINSFYVEGVVTSAVPNDVQFVLDVTAGVDTSSITQSLTVAWIPQMTMTSLVEGVSSNAPPFEGEMECPFSITNSLSPSKHLVIPFHKVATLTTNGFEIADFTVDMALTVAPEGADVSDLVKEWEVVESHPEMSGSLLPGEGLGAQFVNPTQGGIYRFRGRVGGSPWTEGVVVLPLAGASIDATFAADLIAATNTVQYLLTHYTHSERQDSDWGKDWFFYDGMGDYRGRADNADYRTTWLYNQVNDTSGFGSVVTWHGVPVRLAKVSNFMVGYATTLAEVNSSLQWWSTFFEGTADDATAQQSWNAGIALAQGGAVDAVVDSLVRNIWPVSTPKERALWPNPHTADNETGSSWTIDYNFQYIAPGFIRQGRNGSWE